MMKRNEGFTLIELLVTISAGALVTFAAVSLLLLGGRVQYITTQEAREQQTVRIVMSLMEEMAGSGAFNYISDANDGSWKLWNCDDLNDPMKDTDTVVFEYVKTEQSFYRGAASESNSPLLDCLNNASVTLEGKVLRLAFETEYGGDYATRVYCRTLEVKEEELVYTDQEKVKDIFAGQTGVETRLRFLETLATEYANGQNTGRSPTTGEYYSRWYIGAENWGKNGWNKDTPWCACFLSWAAEENEISGLRFANVDTGLKLFADADAVLKIGELDSVEPGDYVFFDWSGDRKDPAHVGAVLDVADTDEDGYLDTIYTIEGNSSGRVAVRQYPVTSESVMAYGSLTKFIQTED